MPSEESVEAIIDLRDDKGLCLSVVMPAHNEEGTILLALEDLLAVDFHPNRMQCIVVDDGSTDRTSLLLGTVDDSRVTVHRHPTRMGKGAAVHSGAALASGTHMVVFDADREYLAGDLPELLKPIASGRAEVVFGTRLFGFNTVYQSFRYAIGNRVTTLLANVLFDACVTDMHTCFKLMSLELFKELDTSHSGFGLDTEITAELLRRGHRPFEVPISYYSRSHAEGKKITWRDGVECIITLARVRLRGNGDSQKLENEAAVTGAKSIAEDRLPSRRNGEDVRI